MTTIKLGSKGSDVETLNGLLFGDTFTAYTEAAVKAFQAAKGLTADGIVGPKTWAALQEPPKADIVLPCEDLKQYASPHGSKVYGPDSSYSTYKSGGCGVVSFAVVQRALGLAPADESATETIQRLGRYSWEHGYRPKGAGTNAGLFGTNGTTYKSTRSAAAIEDALRGGKYVILLIKNGFPNGYGGSGHYVVAYGIQGDTVLLRDVGSSAASRQKAALGKITSGLKYAYIIGKR